MSESSKQLKSLPQDLVATYEQKWKNIALTFNSQNCHSLDSTIASIYNFIGLKKPQILFFDGPYSALKTLATIEINQLGQGINNRIENKLIRVFQKIIEKQINDELLFNLKSYGYYNNIEKLEFLVWQRLHQELKLDLGKKQWQQLDKKLWIVDKLPKKTKNKSNFNKILNGFYGNIWIKIAFFSDFCINVLNCNYNVILWKIIQDIVINSGWIFPFEKICLICSRPLKINLNNEDELHNIYGAAIEYADGYNIYAHHGLILPEKYGAVHPSQWQPQWLSLEKNHQLRQLLIQTIGYNRISQELETIELDRQQGYSLLKVDLDPHLEPIHLLNIHCYETDHFNCLGIPSNISSIKEALLWVNWDLNSTKLEVLA